VTEDNYIYFTVKTSFFPSARATYSRALYSILFIASVNVSFAGTNARKEAHLARRPVKRTYSISARLAANLGEPRVYMAR
jgi:hypothetical protein